MRVGVVGLSLAPLAHPLPSAALRLCWLRTGRVGSCQPRQLEEALSCTPPSTGEEGDRQHALLGLFLKSSQPLPSPAATHTHMHTCIHVHTHVQTHARMHIHTHTEI